MLLRAKKSMNKGWGAFQEGLKRAMGDPDAGDSPSSEKESSQGEQGAKKDRGEKHGGNNGGGPGEGPDPVGPNASGILALLALFVAVRVASHLMEGQQRTEITFQHFYKDLLAKGKVVRLEVANQRQVKVYTSSEAADGGASAHAPGGRFTHFFNIGSVDAFERRLEEAMETLGYHPEDQIPVAYTRETDWLGELLSIVPTLLLFGLGFFAMRQAGRSLGSSLGQMGRGGRGGPGGMFGMGKANITVWDPKSVKDPVTFAQVAGCDEAKEEIMEFVSFLKDPERYKELGAKIPKGALLTGPPGTGKTLLAKATAGEAGVPFFSISGSDFMEMFVGVGPSRVRDLFSQARQSTPSIIFIDEIDAIGRARGRMRAGGNDERESTLNQLLVEMDGFNTKEGIVVLAGTNRADILDKALLRPGRFDRQIGVDRPDVKGREAIFRVHLKNVRTDQDAEFYSERLAALTPGFVGADIANVCNEAALVAARRGKSLVTLEHFEAAVDRVIGGLEKKNRAISKKERRTVAYHEAGHAVVGWFMEHAEPLLKVSIVPRGSAALGFAQYLPSEDVLKTREQLEDMTCMTLGGRAAEEILIGAVSTGAQNDLEKVTQMAYGMVSVYGFSEAVGLLSFPGQEGQLDKPYSPETAQLIDEEARAIVNRCYGRTKELIESKRDLVAKLAEALLEKEVLSLDALEEILGPRPFQRAERANIDKYRSGFAGTPGGAATPGKAAESDRGGDSSIPDPAVAAVSADAPPTWR
ncbi:unnamed protein product [Pedinophyceae sp. YPF-701]|nr:unnamed protein product [Pedinophyceae sp. YPF-701]